MSAKYQNADGLGVKFGNYVTDPKNYINKFREVDRPGHVRQAICSFDLTKIPTGTVAYPADLNNDGTLDGFTEGDFNFPAYSSVLRVIVIVDEVAAGGTSFTVGTYNKAGTAIVATGLVTATEGVLANIDTLGARTYGAGALVSSAVETASVGANAAFPAVAATGTFTAGKGRIIVEYIAPVENKTST